MCPLLEYGSVIWDPHQKQDTDKMEHIHWNTAHFISSSYQSTTAGSVQNVIIKLQIPRLQHK